MKKAFYTFLTFVSLISALSACGKKDDGGGNANGGGDPNQAYAATPTPQACGIPGGNCTTNPYQQYAPQFVDYRWTDNGFCGCPQGYRPVMNTQWGISCAPNSWMQNYRYLDSNYMSFNFRSTVNFYYYAQNGQWSSIPQITYSPAIANPYGQNCFRSALSVCDIRDANSCPNGGYCRSTSGGSYAGLCSNTPGVEHYGSPQPNCTVNSWGITVCGYGYSTNQGNAGDGRIVR